ncbi:ankyrin repeat domain-containing protein [Legionella sp. PC1000]|uniref:ankyrin repeat domain-containing protein n=1 Tax=Legionella sp. PC1000 TaxID=2746060 RepID=UPI001C71492E|nr:ankyrin repeat domain-containing protein [Legionella sp. PC1000]
MMANEHKKTKNSKQSEDSSQNTLKLSERRSLLTYHFQADELESFKNQFYKYMEGIEKGRLPASKKQTFTAYFLSALAIIDPVEFLDNEEPFAFARFSSTSESYTLKKLFMIPNSTSPKGHLDKLNRVKEKKYLGLLADLYEQYGSKYEGKRSRYTKSHFYYCLAISAIYRNNYEAILKFNDLFSAHINKKEISDFFNHIMQEIFKDKNPDLLKGKRKIEALRQLASKTNFTTIFTDRSLSDASKCFGEINWGEMLINNLSFLTNSSEPTIQIFNQILTHYSGDHNFYLALIQTLKTFRTDASKKEVINPLLVNFFNNLIKVTDILEFYDYLMCVYKIESTTDQPLIFSHIIDFIRIKQTAPEIDSLLIKKLKELRKDPANKEATDELVTTFFNAMIHCSNVSTFETYLEDLYEMDNPKDQELIFTHVLKFLRALKSDNGNHGKVDSSLIDEFETNWMGRLQTILSQTTDEKILAPLIGSLATANFNTPYQREPTPATLMPSRTHQTAPFFLRPNGLVPTTAPVLRETPQTTHAANPSSLKLHQFLTTDGRYGPYYAPKLNENSPNGTLSLAEIASHSQNIHLTPMEHSCWVIAKYLKEKYLSRLSQPSQFTKDFHDYILNKARNLHVKQLYSSKIISEHTKFKDLSLEDFTQLSEVFLPTKILGNLFHSNPYSALVANYPLANENKYYTALRFIYYARDHRVFKTFTKPCYNSFTALQSITLICCAINDPTYKRSQEQIEDLYEIVITGMCHSLREYSDKDDKNSDDATRCAPGMIEAVLLSLAGATDDPNLDYQTITIDTLVARFKDFYREQFSALTEEAQKKYTRVDDDYEYLSRDFLNLHRKEFNVLVAMYVKDKHFTQAQIDAYLDSEYWEIKDFKKTDTLPMDITPTTIAPQKVDENSSNKAAHLHFFRTPKLRAQTTSASMESSEDKFKESSKPANYKTATTQEKLDEFNNIINEIVFSDIPSKALVETLISLLKSGIDVDAVLTEKGQTALHLAVIHNKSDLVGCLLDHGADKDAQDSDLKTPRDYYNEDPKAHVDMMMYFSIEENKSVSL